VNGLRCMCTPLLNALSICSPAGINLGSPNPVWLVDGDVVEVGLTEIGTCTNKYIYM